MNEWDTVYNFLEDRTEWWRLWVTKCALFRGRVVDRMERLDRASKLAKRTGNDFYGVIK